MTISDNISESAADFQEGRTGYLAAPMNTDLKVLEALLVERQIQPIVSADLSSTASTFLEGVVNAISNAYLFIAILSPERPNHNVFMELGIAIARERRILIIAPLEVPLMLDIAEIPSIRTEVTNRNAISFMLDQMLVTPPRKYKPPIGMSVPQKGRPIGDLANGLLDKLAASGTRVREDEIIQLVVQALQSSGYSTIEKNPLLGVGKTTTWADLIVWSEEFGPWIGNPLIIEVKRAPVDPMSAVPQVLSYLQLSQTRSALILFGNKTTSTSKLSSALPPNIFFLNIYELLSAMRTKSFAQIMIDMRNRRVHGIDA